MKLNHLLTGICLFMALWCSGTTCLDSTRLMYEEYPALAIKTADSLYTEATLTGNKPLLLKAIIQKTVAQLNIDREAYPKAIEEVENHLAQEKDSVAQSILHAFTGDLYAKYYQSKNRQIGLRRPLEGYVPKDIREWSENLFKEKVFYHYLASVQAHKSLQQTPRTKYAVILELGGSSDTLRPTMYDFLGFRAIEKLSDVRWNDNRLPIKDPIDKSIHLLGEMDEFTALEIPDMPSTSSNHILRLYQNLLKFRQKAGDPSALLMADLDRLKYVLQISQLDDRYDLYLSTLQSMRNKYMDIPTVVEVMAEEIRTLQRMASPHRAEKILAICEEGIRTYPAYSRIDQLRREQAAVLDPVIQVEYPNYIMPDEKIKLKVQSQNTKEVTLILYKIDATTAQYQEWLSNKNSKLQESVFRKQTYILKSGYYLQDTTLNFPAIPNGLYRFAIQGVNIGSQLSKYFICNNLITTEQKTQTGRRFLVRDARSGLPVKNAKIRIYQNKSYRSYTLLDSLYTDNQGYAKTNRKGDYYETIDKHNPNGYILGLRREWEEESNGEKDGISNLQLITDRQLYRPGQTVFFKGIAWFSSSDTLHALKGQVHNVAFLDANSKEISRKQFKTNEFGSFAGKFTIPDQVLNGHFSLVAGEDRTYIQVANYKRPEFDITLKSSENKYHFGDVLKIQGSVSSFSGVPTSRQKVTFEVSSRSFGWRGNEELISNGIVHTDESGAFTLDFKAEKASMPFRPWGITYYEITASVTDAKGETESSTLTIPVFSDQAQLNMQIPERIDKNTLSPLLFYLEDAEPGIENVLSYKIHRLKTPQEIRVLPDIKDTLTDALVLEGHVRILGNDTARLTPDLRKFSSGAYLLSLENKGITSKSIFYLYATTDKRPPIPTYDWLVEEKTTCLPGEEASILFGTSARNAHVRCEVYTRQGLVRASIHQLSDGILPIKIPYLANYGPEIWLYLDYVKDGHYIQHTIPIRKFQNSQLLQLETKVFRDNLLPGQQEQWEIRVKNQAGKPIRSEVLALMYDASLDKLTPHDLIFKPSFRQLPFPFGWNYSQDENGKGYITSNPQAYREKSYQIPPFQFDRLKIFLSVHDMLSNRLENGDQIFSFASATPTKQIRGTGMQMKQANKGVDFRQNFSEVAFFYPQLTSDVDGNVMIRFTVPESSTKWKFMALAQTPEMSVGQFTGYATTSRQLMVRPNLPRFFRSGDHAELKTIISNLSDKRQAGKASICLFVPGTTKILTEQSVDFDIAAGESQSVTFGFDVPPSIDLAGCRISAVSETFSDGEEHLVPVLPDKMLVTSTLPIYTSQKGTQTFTLKNKFPKSENYYRLTLEVTSNPVWYALLALPRFQEPQNESVTDIAGAFYVNTVAARIVSQNPKIAEMLKNWMASPEGSQTLLSKLEQNSELRSILLEASPWVADAQNETEQMQTLLQLFDQNRLTYLQENALQKLKALQTSDGGWSWFKDMRPSRFITCNVLAIMSQASLTGEKEYGESEKIMQMNALRYLDEEIRKDYEKPVKQIGYDQIVYLYVRSLYRDIPLGDALAAHKYYMALAQKQWAMFSLYEKAVMATTMQHYGLGEDARAIVKSLRQYAIVSPKEGMFWPNNQNYYRNSALLTHTAIMEAFHEVEGVSPATDQMKMWLLNQKRVQNWGNAPSTVNAVYAILLTGSGQLSTPENLTLALGNKKVPLPATNDPLGYMKWGVSAGEITPDMLTVKINKQTSSPTWGGIYFQYYEQFSRISKEANGLQIDKKLFVEQTATDGTKKLLPADQHPLKLGDKIVVRLTLSLSRNMEYIHLKDLRAACLEPENQLSGNHWNFGTMYYEDVKDAATNFFFTSLAKGTYVVEYPLRVSQAGDYQNGIATLQSIYAPEFTAHSNAQRIIVNDN